MHQETYQGVVVPAPVWMEPLKQARYGTIADLPEEELADPEELERQVYREEFAPILALPAPSRGSGIRAAVADNGGVDWGAFGTVDFDRHRPEWDKARYKADKLREQVKNLLITFAVIRDRIPGRAKYRVLKYLQMGILDIGQIEDFDMYQLAEVSRRIRRLQGQIAELEQASRARQAKRLRAWLDAL